MRLIFAITFLGLFSFSLNGQFLGQSDNSLRVTGVSIAKEIPDIIELKLSIGYGSLNYTTCSDSLLIISGNVSDVFVQNGIKKEDLRVSKIAINENHVYEGGTRTKQGYIGNIIITLHDQYSQNLVKSIFEAIGSLNDPVEFNVSFSLSEEQKEKLRRLTLEKAIVDANEKAQIIAKQSNTELVKINKIDFQNNTGYGLNDYDDELAFEEELLAITRRAEVYSGLEFDPKEISIARSVVIEWTIKNKE